MGPAFHFFLVLGEPLPGPRSRGAVGWVVFHSKAKLGWWTCRVCTVETVNHIHAIRTYNEFTASRTHVMASICIMQLVMQGKRATRNQLMCSRTVGFVDETEPRVRNPPQCTPWTSKQFVSCPHSTKSNNRMTCHSEKLETRLLSLKAEGGLTSF